jgi:DNA-binding transcriptional ArsR family regulator
VSDKRSKKDAVEVSSQPIQDELVAIKDRLNAIETIQSISNATVVKQYVQEHLKTKDAMKIMKECEEPKTKSHLQTSFGYKSKQALDHHLKPLREADLLRQKVEDDGTIVFEWSNLFRRLPKSTIRSILVNSK